MLVFQGTWVVGLDFFQHLGHAVGAEKGRAFSTLDVTHTFSQMRTLV